MTAPSKIGPYTVLGTLGAGGMGEVYRGRDSRLAREVAIKVLPEAFADDPERLARFSREAQTLASLNHPNIAAIYGVEEAPARDGNGEVTHALVMELVQGDDLSDLVAKGPMPVEDAVPIARQIAEALEAAHDQGIVHRDLKPANVKVRQDGTVKVLDFGLAKATVQAASAGELTTAGSSNASVTTPAPTQQGLIMGTASYMSPEQAKGRPVDRRTDIWSFGVVLFEMLSGSRLFAAESTAETLAAVLTREPDFASLPATVPTTVVALLRRCLERDPRQRLRDIGEARLVLADPRALQVPAPPPEFVATPPGHGSGFWLGIAALCAVLGFAGGFAAARVTQPTPSLASPAPALTITPITSSGNVISASVSPDGRYIAYVESEQGQQSLWLMQVAGGQTLRLVPEQRATYWGHTFTPDGNSIVFGVKRPDDIPGALYSISTLGGVPKRIVGNIDSPPTFSPDGKRMAFLRNRFPDESSSALVVSDIDGSSPKTLFAAKAPDYVAGIFYGAPAWSPDGATIVTAVNSRASARRDTSARLVRISVANGSASTLAEPGWLSAAQAGWMPDGRSLLVIARSMSQLNSQVWSVSFPGGEARPITSDLNERRIISLTADGRTLVTVGSTVTSQVVYLPFRGGGRSVRVSRSRLDGLRGVAFTPNSQLVYTSDVNEGIAAFAAKSTFVAKGGDSSLWRASTDASDRGQILSAAETTLAYPAVADDGRVFFLAMTRSGTELRSAAKDGTDVRVIARDVDYDTVSVSNDGKTVVYTAAANGAPHIFKVTPGGTPTQLTQGTGFSGAIDPAGKRVAFYHVSETEGFRIGVMSVNGGPLLADIPAEPPPSTSRLVLRDEGIYVNTMPNDRANIWLQPLDGRPARRVTTFDDQNVFDFALSRDGGSLVVVRGPRVRDAQIITGFAAPADAAAGAH